jgi:dTDP-4-amino-4,6-dideoxygalactose transaminase
MRIPLVDLASMHAEIAGEVDRGFAELLASGAFVQGPQVTAFEQAFAEFSEVQHCVGVANGTDALELALRAVGVGPGDEVILPANTFIATAEAVARAGATPVLVDCDPAFLLIDTEAVAARMGAKTKAIVPVHLFGQAAPVEDLTAMARDLGVALVEDHAQSHGATRNGRAAGSLGIAAATSFYPGKNLGAYGDGGAVLTDSDEVAARVRALGNHGSTARYQHPELGFNSRLDSLQAVVLSAKLARLAAWNKARAAAAERYSELLAGPAGLAGITLPATMPGNTHVWHLYVVRFAGGAAQRDAVASALHAAGVGAGIHYPVPVHLQGAFAGLGHSPGDFPVAEAAAASMLSLPLFPHLSEEQIDHVVGVLTAAVS